MIDKAAAREGARSGSGTKDCCEIKIVFCIRLPAPFWTLNAYIITTTPAREESRSATEDGSGTSFPSPFAYRHLLDSRCMYH